MKKLNKISIVFVALFLATEVAVYAQEGFDLFNTFGFNSRKERQRNSITKINSETLDIQYKNNIIVFKGNVVLDDQDVKIECDQMIIKLEDDPQKKVGKKPKYIECIGNFVATRKVVNPEEKKHGSQKAVAGKAVLQMDSGKIVMMNNPMIIRGNEALKGTKITIWIRNEKLVAENAQVKTLGGDFLGTDFKDE